MIDTTIIKLRRNEIEYSYHKDTGHLYAVNHAKEKMSEGYLTMHICAKHLTVKEAVEGL